MEWNFHSQKKVSKAHKLCDFPASYAKWDGHIVAKFGAAKTLGGNDKAISGALHETYRSG